MQRNMSIENTNLPHFPVLQPTRSASHDAAQNLRPRIELSDTGHEAFDFGPPAIILASA